MVKEKRKDNKAKADPIVKQYMLTLFIFLLPLLIIAFTEEFITKILLFCYEGILLSNFIRDKLNADIN